MNQSFAGAPAGIIGAGKIVQGVSVDEPGIVDLVSREVALAAKALNGFRVHLKAAGGFQYAKVVIQYRHNTLPVTFY
jgi:hypothetical protein